MNVLSNLRNGTLNQRDVKNEDRSRDVCENKGMNDIMPEN
jgi:hypothetical protein